MGSRYSGTSYEAASKWLTGGRFENYRPTGSSNTYMARVDEHSIAVVLHYTPIITYCDDGTQVIYMGGWNTQTTLKRLREFSAATIYSSKRIPYVWEHTPKGFTPPKVWKCRTCSGSGKLSSRCYGPHWCYRWSNNKPCQHGMSENHLPSVCEHGKQTGHHLSWYDCWRCEGKGRADYGSKPIYHSFSAHQAVRVDTETGVWLADVDNPKRPSKDRSPRQGAPKLSQQPVRVDMILARVDPTKLVKATVIAVPTPTTFPPRPTGGH